MIIEKISEDPDVQRRYEELILVDGQTPRFAEMLATRSFPGINGTNKAFNRGRVNGNQFANCPALGSYYKAIAERAGVSVNGRFYCHGLGRFPGDPRAWCADTEDVLRIARERNLSLDGIVSRIAEPTEPKPDIPLAEDLWKEATQEVMSGNPDMRLEDAREKAFNLRTGRDRPAEDDGPFGDVNGSLTEAMRVTE